MKAKYILIHVVLSAILIAGCTIEGTVTDNGTALEGVTVTLGSGTKVTTTDSDGHYEFKGLTGTQYSVTPSMPGYMFSPNSQKVIFSMFKTVDRDVDFETTASGTVCSGSIKSDGKPLAGVDVVISGDIDITLVTDSMGEYRMNLENGDYTLTPELDCFTFEPASLDITVDDADISDLDFEGDGQIWEGDYHARTQGDIDALSGYVYVTGNLTIGGDVGAPSTFTDVTGLECLKYVGGYLYIKYNKNLVDLDGLNNLSSVNIGHVSIAYNSALKILDGFDNLSEIGYVLSINDNAVLAKIEGFNNVTAVKNIVIKNNDLLTKIGGLTKISSVNNLQVEGNRILTTLEGGFKSLTNIEGLLEVNYNDALKTLGSLGDLESIQSHLRIVSNDALTDLDLDDLDYIGGDFYIAGNGSLCTGTAEDLRVQVVSAGGIGGSVAIVGNKDCD